MQVVTAAVRIPAREVQGRQQVQVSFSVRFLLGLKVLKILGRFRSRFSVRFWLEHA
jgi:hypothetical protein